MSNVLELLAFILGRLSHGKDDGQHATLVTSRQIVDGGMVWV
jgi:hypothetical protein